MRRCSAALLAALFLVPLPAASAGSVPEWARPAVDYLAGHDYIERADFKPNAPMGRRAFKRLMRRVFGGGYEQTGGDVTAAEVDEALVGVLGYRELAARLDKLTSPDGWTPELPDHFGTEIVSRALGLRHNRPIEEDRFEASAAEPLRGADVAWAVWIAETDPATWAADLLDEFALGNYDETRRGAIGYALSLVGTPYVWAGEWPEITPESYPYGAQVHGGFDCSGYIWYVLKRASDDYEPVGRPYEGWRLEDRSSAQMAAGTPRRIRFGRLQPTDLLFFAPSGRNSSAGDVFHAGVYLGDGWMIHSSGSYAGVGLSYVGADSWWRDRFAWGRRIIRTA